MDRSRPDGPNYKMNWTEWIEQTERTELDQNRPKWTELTEEDQMDLIGPNSLKWTEIDRIRLSSTELD